MTTDDKPGSSLSPIEIEGAAFDIEAAAMHKGNGKKLVALTLSCAAVIGVSVLALGDLDNRQAFLDAGTRMNSLHEVGYERFWNCALIGMNQSQIKSADELESQIHKRAEHYGMSYATLMKKCGSSLDSLERDLDVMQAPKPIQPQLRGMKEAVTTTRRGLHDLINHMERYGSKYDDDDGERYTGKLAIGWQQYRVSHQAFREALREHLQ
jgi:hypothetical protein